MSDTIPIVLAGQSPFEQIRHVAEDGSEYWMAREFARLLEYTDWRNFEKVIKRARTACMKSAQLPRNHFVEVNEMVPIGSGAERELPSYHLTRYACYLVAQNADPSKDIVAKAQSYFKKVGMACGDSCRQKRKGTLNMSIDRKTVDHVALLARLALTEKEREVLREQMSSILEHINLIGEADTSQVPATAHVLPLSNVMTDDKVVPSMSPADLLANAPAREETYFRVRAVLDEE